MLAGDPAIPFSPGGMKACCPPQAVQPEMRGEGGSRKKCHIASLSAGQESNRRTAFAPSQGMMA
jgi:hypothetical protein